MDCIKEIDKSIDNLENVVFVQATSPLNNSSDLSRIMKILSIHDNVAFYIDDYGFFFDYHDITSPRMSRQARKALKRECGNAWAFDKKGFISNKSRLFGKVGLCRIEHSREIEIDEIEDITTVSCLISKF
ncbi:hypothetical protein OAT09_02670 [Alphaproteobacteria bacterium]|nr:hypothetical protein [Alphaproteobacteria bacterium]